MRKTIHKWYWAWDFDKEEKWLNKMAAKGLALVSVAYCTYTFEECLPGKYNIRLELLDNLPSHTESQQYIQFLEETGAQYLGTIMRWAYFRKETDHGEFDLFSDNASRIRHLNRMLCLIGVLCLTNLFFGLSNISIFHGIGLGFNFGVGMLNICLALFLGYGYLLIYLKKRRLQKEQQLFE